MTFRSVAAACFALVASLASAAAWSESPTIYKWIDEQGIAHYTTDKDRIPREVRTRVERTETGAATPAPLHSEDVMRDAVKTKRNTTVAAPAPTPAAPTPTREPIPSDVPDASETSEPVAEEPIPAPSATAAVAPEPIAAPEPEAAPPPAPVEEVEPEVVSEAPAESDSVSAPPPAPIVPLEPQQMAELTKIDSEIQAVESEISAREEKLAALISSADDQHTTALVDDPGFIEISQNLPRLQAELQTLRERRNKIQPTARP